MNETILNREGYDLLKMLSIEDFVKSKPESLDNISGIPKPITLKNSIQNFVEHSQDGYGNIIDSYFHLDNKKIGFNTRDYKLLQNLAAEFIKCNQYNEHADLIFIEKSIFEWVKEIYTVKRARVDLTTFLQDKIESELSSYLFYFKIENLGNKRPFKIGGVEITYLSEEFLDNEFKQLNLKRPISKEKFNNLYKDFKNKVVASISITAVRSKAEIIAKREVNLSLNALKCVLLYESIDWTTQIFDLDFNYHNSDSSTFLTRNCKKDSSLCINLQRNHGARPIIILEENLNKYKKLGLEKISDFLNLKRASETDFQIEDAINHLGDIVSTRDLHIRAVKIISFFERIIIPKNSTRAQGQSLLKKNILPKLPYKQKDFLIPIINKFYKTRDKYLHNRIEVHIDLQDLFEMQKLCLVFLLYLITLKKELATLDDVLNHFEIAK